MPTLNWIGKEAVVNHHLTVPFRLLKDVPELSCGDPGSGNLIVEGDNLVALKALLPYYAGQVKCIYIDPPYNTGNEGWAYNDNVNSPLIREWIGKAVGKEGETLDRHDRWLCMMYPRLALLKEFLRKDGVILVHIDENELHGLVGLMDEIFLRQNRLGEIVWDKGNPKGDSTRIASQHETIVCYARSATFLKERGKWFGRKKPNADKILKKANSLFKKVGKTILPEELAAIAKKYSIDAKLLSDKKRLMTRETAQEELRIFNNSNQFKGGEKPYFRLTERGRVYRLISMAWPNKKKAPDEYFEAIIDPETGKCYPAPDKGWRYPPRTIESLIKDKLIEFPSDGETQPQKVLFLDENMSERLPSVIKFGGSDEALFKDLRLSFDYQKPTDLAAELIDIFSDKDSIILDSFGGSGTTGHAVLKCNRSDGGSRKFVIVEIEPEIAKTTTSQRLRKVVEGYTTKKRKAIDGLSGGFRYCQLGEPLFDETGEIRKSVSFTDLARHVWFTETGEPLPRERVRRNPFLGDFRGTGIYLLYNGILADKSPEGGNVLTRSILADLPPFDGPRVIYCAGCRIGGDRLRREGITIRQTPYEIKVS